MNAVLADVIIYPYREIEVSGVRMAALRYGRPIIASGIGGLAEPLVDGRHGILVPPDDPTAPRRCTPLQRSSSALPPAAGGSVVAGLGAAIPNN